MKRYTFTKQLFAILMAGLLLRLYYLSYTDYKTRTHDVDGHLEYINYIANNYRLPTADQCWQCFHPPLYYLMAAVIFKVLEIFFQLPTNTIYRILQLFSLGLFSLFNLVAVALFKKVLQKNKLTLLATLLFTFWPSGIIHSVRIGNDVLLYLLYSLSLYYLISWWLKETKLDLLIASFYAVFSLLTKSNGVVIVVIIIMSFMIKMRKGMGNKPLRLYLANYFEIIIILLVGITTFLYLVVSDPSRDHWIVGNFKGLEPILNVENRISNYLLFDLRAYVSQPNIIPWSDTGGRQFFWNYLLKTSIFGGFPIKSSFHKKVAIILSITFFLQVLFTATIFLLLLLLVRVEIERLTPLFLNFFFLLASNIFLRITIPVAPSSDFRYIYPLLLSWIVMIVISVDDIKRNTILKYIGYSLLTLFVISSIIFYLVPQAGNHG